MQGFTARKALESISPYVAGKPIEETAREYGLDPSRIVKLASKNSAARRPRPARRPSRL